MAQDLSVLIVDDDVFMAKTLGDILDLLGYKVTVVNSGMEAIELVKNKKYFDCMFLDIRMPEMNGVETFKNIKHYMPECLVVMMTAYALPDLIEQAKSEGALDVVYKPVNLEKVTKMLEIMKNKSAVIIVDDDRDFCNSLRDLLVEKKYKVTGAYNGYEAIDIVENNNFDFIILDMKLPDIHGLKVMGAIRQIDPKIVIILISAFDDMVPLMNEAKKDCALAALKKPFQMEEVLGIMEKIKKKKLSDAL
jgi:DNA-binding NtrC family response regulator